MNEENKIAFLGGDLRQHTAAVCLSDGEWDIYVWGQDCPNGEKLIFCDDLQSAIDGARAVVLPLPTSIDGTFLNCRADACDKKIALLELADAISPTSTVIGGKIPAAFCDRVLSRGIRCYDYFGSEAFQIKNAYTTAEAALFIAMEKLPKNICGAEFAITGYGRIAKPLTRLLLSMGARVTVCARRESDLVWAELAGAKTKLLREHDRSVIDSLASGYDVIYNTVPSWLFDEKFLKRADPHTLMIELASAPGGIDVSAAKRLHSNVLWAASLPGKYAPQSAGELIGECVRALIERKDGEL